jgi:ferric-dicitrate binding protein FerR (iron transport regulator)
MEHKRMNSMSGNRTYERVRIVSEEAAEWFIRCCDERMMQLADRREFLAWLRRSPENIAEIFRIAKVAGKVGQVILNAAGVDESNVIDLGMGSGASQHDQQTQVRASAPHAHEETMKTINNKPPSRWKTAAIAAAATVVLVLAFAENRSWFEPTITTQASQWQHMTLEDGTVVHVGARTKLRVDFSDELRIVHVYRGEAVFEVAKDADRPFIARTSLIDATAIGTRFGVMIDPGVTTTVSEGIVRVTARGKPDGNSVELRAGDELRVSDSGLLAPSLELAKVDAEKRLDWVNGWWSFDGQTVGEIAHEFNRRNVVQVKIDDPAIAARRQDFQRLRIGLPEEFAKLVAAQPDVILIQERSGKVLHLQLE